MDENTPDPDTPAPAAIAHLAGTRSVRAVWRNDLGGLTFEVGAGIERQFVKWSPHGSGLDLTREAARLRWAVEYTAVPAVVAVGADADGQWLVKTALPGENAATPRWVADPARAVAAIGRALRALHDALPVAECPFDWSVQRRLAELDEAGRHDPARWHPCHQHLDSRDARERLTHPPRIDRLVVCHGDSCAPHTLLTEDGACSGHVDLGSLGVADRWADLAVATWSAEWTYGPGWADVLLEAYGTAPDEQRSAYYRLLWDLSP